VGIKTVMSRDVFEEDILCPPKTAFTYFWKEDLSTFKGLSPRRLKFDDLKTEYASRFVPYRTAVSRPGVGKMRPAGYVQVLHMLIIQVSDDLLSHSVTPIVRYYSNTINIK
jgi:hypothetical protein